MCTFFSVRGVLTAASGAAVPPWPQGVRNPNEDLPRSECPDRMLRIALGHRSLLDDTLRAGECHHEQVQVRVTLGRKEDQSDQGDRAGKLRLELLAGLGTQLRQVVVQGCEEQRYEHCARWAV